MSFEELIKGLELEFTHIDHVENYLFLWSENYSKRIIIINLATQQIEHFEIEQNIKIHWLKVIHNKNTKHLVISENRSFPRIHFIDISNPKTPSLCYRNFEYNIIQMECVCFSSNTLLVLNSHYFNIIGLNSDCDTILFHRRIPIDDLNIMNFCIVSPKYLHNKIFENNDFYYGFSRFAAYLLNKNGDIFVCSPIIPDRFQCNESLLLPLENDFESDSMKIIYESWMTNKWSRINEMNNSQFMLLSYDGKKSQFMHNGEVVKLDIYKLNIANDLDNEETSKSRKCCKLIMINLDAFFLNDLECDLSDEKENEAICIAPIFVRVWNNHSIDIVACLKPIIPSWKHSLIDEEVSDEFDSVVIYKNCISMDDCDKKLASFSVNKCVQHLDELIICNDFEGLYRLKMPWLKDLPCALRNNSEVQLLQNCKSSLIQLPLHQFYVNLRESEFSKARMSDVCICKENILVLDPSMKRIHVLSLKLSHLNAISDDFSEKKLDDSIPEIETVDLLTMKQFDVKEVEELKSKLGKLMLSTNEFENGFDWSEPSSLEFFLKNVKNKLDLFLEDIDISVLSMTKRASFIQKALYSLVSQVKSLQEKEQQIYKNNDKLIDSANEIIQNNEILKKQVAKLQNQMCRDNTMNCNDENSQQALHKFGAALSELRTEMNALEYDEKMLMSDLKNNSNSSFLNMRWSSQDYSQITNKIRVSIKNQNDKLTVMVGSFQKDQHY